MGSQSEAWTYLMINKKITHSHTPNNQDMTKHFCELIEGEPEQESLNVVENGGLWLDRITIHEEYRGTR